MSSPSCSHQNYKIPATNKSMCEANQHCQGHAISILSFTDKASHCIGGTVYIVFIRSALIWVQTVCKGYYRPHDKSVYLKFIFFISHQKHMLWVLKRIVSMRQFF